MAENNQEALVEVPEEGVVTVDLEGAEGAAATPAVAPASEVEPEVHAEPAPKADTKPPKPSRKAAEVPKPDEATLALQEALRASQATAEAERQRAEEVLRRSQQREQEWSAAREQQDARELASLDKGIEDMEREIGNAKKEHTRALEAGEFSAVTDAQERIARASSMLIRLQDAKEDYQNRPLIKPHEGAVAEPAPTSTNRVDQYLSSVSPRSQTWLRQHPECLPSPLGGNAVKNAQMMQGHWAALAQGYQTDTDDYFRVIEEHAGFRQPINARPEPEEPEDEPAPKPRAAPKPPQASAPPSREPMTPNPVPQTTRSVRLDPQQQEAALISWPQQQGEETIKWRQRAFANYARELVKLNTEDPYWQRRSTAMSH